MAKEERELPLFSLGTVLFPGMPIPIQVFEERYRQMVADIQASDSKFGVVLIKEGSEVGEPAMPHPVGTVAQIIHADHTPDGRIFLSALGLQRFSIQKVLRQRPYIVANVELLAEDTTAPAELAEAVHNLYNSYVQQLLGMAGGWTRAITIPTEPLPLSYLVANTIGSSSIAKQYLLEVSTVEERLRMEMDMLKEASHLLQERMQKEGPSRRFGAN